MLHTLSDLHVICRLAVGIDVESFALFLLGDTQANHKIGDFKGDQRDHA